MKKFIALTAILLSTLQSQARGPHHGEMREVIDSKIAYELRNYNPTHKDFGVNLSRWWQMLKIKAKTHNKQD